MCCVCPTEGSAPVYRAGYPTDSGSVRSSLFPERGEAWGAYQDSGDEAHKDEKLGGGSFKGRFAFCMEQCREDRRGQCRPWSPSKWGGGSEQSKWGPEAYWGPYWRSCIPLSGALLG